MSKWLTVVAGLAAALVAAGSALAHPHSWIDLRSRVIMNEEGRVAALELDWLFDDLYTALSLRNSSSRTARHPSSCPRWRAPISVILPSMVISLDVRLDGERLALGEPAGAETGLRDQRLWLRFEVPLARTG